jgi:O-antigen/teichoic acid export membrane protein
LRWSAVDAVGRQGVGFAVAVILARLLCLAEFGLVGMLYIFSALASSIVDSGFGSALIQRRAITESDKCSVFYFNVAVGTAGAITLLIAASPVAHFYREPLLLPMMRWMALNLFIESLGVVQVALLTRSLDFRSQFKAGFLALLISGSFAVMMAAAGYGVWSLVAQTLVFTTVFTALVWGLCSWRPRAAFNARSLRSLASFGSPLLLSGLLNVLFDRLHMAVIGKSFSAIQLGYYTRAYSTQQFPSGLLSTIVGRVMLPVFSEMSGDIAVLRQNVRNALVSMMLIILPMMFGLAVVARPMVLVLFGDKWLPCVPYLRWLCLASACWPIHVINLNVTMAVGRSDLFLRLEIVKKILIGVGIICTFQISVLAMVWATVIVSMLAAVVNSHYSERLIQYGFRKQLVDLAPYIAASLLMVGAGWGVIHSIHPGPAIQLVVTTATCAACYATCCRWFKPGGMSTLLDVVAGRRPKAAAGIPSSNIGTA